MACILGKTGPVDKLKLMKLLYLADRCHFISDGYSITGDIPYAMKHGPVLSRTLDALDGDFHGVHDKLFPYVHIENYTVSLICCPPTQVLSQPELETINHVITVFGDKSTSALVKFTHDLGEWIDTYKSETSTRIPFELIAKHSNDSRRFWKGRVVISPEAAERMPCPFPSGSDL